MIGFIRHGITKWNKEGRTQGAIDIPLDEEGIQMARKLGERLSFESWGLIYTSPLQRARETAELIASKQPRLKVRTDYRLREVGEGRKEGTTEMDRVRKWGGLWRNLPLGIERDERVMQRIMSFIDEVKKDGTHKKVLVVSHGSFIKKVIQVLCPTVRFHGEIKNASLTIITLNDQNRCILLNCVKHLN